MKTIYKKTKETPSVIFSKNKLELEGNIIIFNNEKFWKDISKEIVENNQLKSLDFNIEYINTDSIRQILLLLKNQSISNIEINWYYDEYDEDMKDLVESLSIVSSKKINLVEKV